MKDLGNHHYQYQMNGTELIVSGNRDRHGIISLQRPEIDQELVKTQTSFILNLYRLNSRGKFRGLARKEPFNVEVANDQQVTLQFPPTEVHPLYMQATYHIRDENVIELEISIEAQADLDDYEVFISSYMNGILEAYTVIPTWPGKTAAEDMRLYKAEDQPLLKGYYLYFPRDDKAAHVIYDGRWIDESNGKRIAEIVSGPMYGKPIAIMANEQLSIIQMAEASACAGTLLTYTSEEHSDPIHKHHACYFSLFGNNIRAGEKRQTRIRQVIRPGKPDLQDIIQLYDQFAGEQALHTS